VDLSWTPVALACDPSLSEGRDQDGCGSKTAQANSLQDPISKKLITKKGLWGDSRYKPWGEALVLQKEIKKHGLG
jgi:hypothetical protein